MKRLIAALACAMVLFAAGKDIKLADINFFQNACDRKISQGCFNLGVAYNKGLGIKQDYEKARIFFSKACELGDETGCYNLGVLYEKGR